MEEIVITKDDTILVFPADNRSEAEAAAAKYFIEEYNYHFNGQ